jgi:hypothetical protein
MNLFRFNLFAEIYGGIIPKEVLYIILKYRAQPP